MTTGKVSIIMPVYNSENHVQAAIQSVLDQSYQNWELLVVNDGSTDNSKEILLSINDTRIKYYEQENQGVSSARNLALSKIAGDFFCFLDSDDAMPANSLTERLKLFDDPAIHFADGSVNIYDLNFNNILETRIHTYVGPPLGALCNIDSSCFFGPSWMIRRIDGRDYRFLDGLTHGEELLFYMTIAQQGAYAATKHVTYHYRSGHQSAMSDLTGLQKGYTQIYQQLVHVAGVSTDMRRSFRKKSRSIMCKSYLGKFRIFEALNCWLRM